MIFEAMARKHWTTNLPELTKQLKEAGTFETEITEAAEQAREELSRRVSRGENLEIAKADVLRAYILLDPETSE